MTNNSSMFLSKEIILHCFRSLSKIDSSVDGKKRQEMVSAVRYFLATAELVHATGNRQINLAVGNDLRSDFIKAVGNVVRFGQTKTYSLDFGDGIKSSADFAVGSNFLTTVVKSSAGKTREYPSRQRNSPLLSLSDWVIELHQDFSKHLRDTYEIDAYISELIIWLLRTENFKNVLSQSSTPDEIRKVLIEVIESRYGNIFSDFYTLSEPKIVTLLESFGNKVFSDELYEFEGFNNSADANTDISLLEEDNSVLVAFNRALGKGERNFLFFGAPGTGKTWYASKIADTIATDPTHIKLLQFHPSISYDDFVEGYVAELDEKSGQLRYSIKNKHFIKISDSARVDPSNFYFLIIDELSRGDPARVFGELLTYIETDYRDKPFSLGYSDKTFSVPNNLVIIATANPFDRSVADLDDAFLRRFFMLKFDSDKDLLAAKLHENGVDAGLVKKLLHFFTAIETNFPNGFGHAQFFGIGSSEDAKNLWETKLSFIAQRSLEFETEKYTAIEEVYDQLFGSRDELEEDLDTSEQQV